MGICEKLVNISGIWYLVSEMTGKFKVVSMSKDRLARGRQAGVSVRSIRVDVGRMAKSWPKGFSMEDCCCQPAVRRFWRDDARAFRPARRLATKWLGIEGTA